MNDELADSSGELKKRWEQRMRSILVLWIARWTKWRLISVYLKTYETHLSRSAALPSRFQPGVCSNGNFCFR